MICVKIRCPDNCNYRQKEAPVCGFCLMKILKDMKLKRDEGGEADGQKSEDKGAGKAD